MRSVIHYYVCVASLFNCNLFWLHVYVVVEGIFACSACAAGHSCMCAYACMEYVLTTRLHKHPLQHSCVLCIYILRSVSVILLLLGLVHVSYLVCPQSCRLGTSSIYRRAEVQ